MSTCNSVALNALVLVFCRIVSLNAGYLCIMWSVYLQSKYRYITKKVSAYSPTEECWLGTLRAQSAAASLKVDEVKYEEKNTESTR